MVRGSGRQAGSGLVCMVLILLLVGTATGRHPYNGAYSGDHLTRIAFPIGGIGAGMFCLEGTGAISHLSVRNEMRFTNEPCSFAALCIKDPGGNVAKVLEGPVPGWKVFGASGTGNGAAGKPYGLPRFDEATFLARFPFARICSGVSQDAHWKGVCALGTKEETLIFTFRLPPPLLVKERTFLERSIIPSKSSSFSVGNPIMK